MGGTAIAIDDVVDHIHILLKLKPTCSLSGMMKKAKGNSSKWVNGKDVLGGHFSWQEGYGAFSVGESQLQRTLTLGLVEKSRRPFGTGILWIGDRVVGEGALGVCGDRK